MRTSTPTITRISQILAISPQSCGRCHTQNTDGHNSEGSLSLSPCSTTFFFSAYKSLVLSTTIKSWKRQALLQTNSELRGNILLLHSHQNTPHIPMYVEICYLICIWNSPDLYKWYYLHLGRGNILHCYCYCLSICSTQSYIVTQLPWTACVCYIVYIFCRLRVSYSRSFNKASSRKTYFVFGILGWSAGKTQHCSSPNAIEL